MNKYPISKLVVKDIIEMLDDWFSISITSEYVDKMYSSDDFIKEEIDNGTYYDTLVREHMADFIANDVVGRSWPMGCEGSSEEFFSAFKEKASKHNITVKW